MHCILLLQHRAIKDKPEQFHSVERNMQYLERGTKWPIDSERASDVLTAVVWLFKFMAH